MLWGTGIYRGLSGLYRAFRGYLRVSRADNGFKGWGLGVQGIDSRRFQGLVVEDLGRKVYGSDLHHRSIVASSLLPNPPH